MTGLVMSKMPSKSTCIVYGVLSEQPISDVEPILLLGKNQRIEGFLLNLYLETKSTWALLNIISKTSKLIDNKSIHSDVSKIISLFEVREAIPEYKKNMTAGKYLIFPQLEDKRAGELSEEVQKDEERKE